jgi:hypothetical protein
VSGGGFARLRMPIGTPDVIPSHIRDCKSLEPRVLFRISVGEVAPISRKMDVCWFLVSRSINYQKSKVCQKARCYKLQTSWYDRSDGGAWKKCLRRCAPLLIRAPNAKTRPHELGADPLALRTSRHGVVVLLCSIKFYHHRRAPPQGIALPCSSTCAVHSASLHLRASGIGHRAR